MPKTCDLRYTKKHHHLRWERLRKPCMGVDVEEDWLVVEKVGAVLEAVVDVELVEKGTEKVTHPRHG